MDSREQQSLASSTTKRRKRRGRIAHPAFGIVDCFRQCDLTKMCGVYAVFNAFRLALGIHRGFRHRRATELYSQTITQWQSEGVLADVMISGIGMAKAKRLARTLAKTLSSPVMALAVEVPKLEANASIDDLFEWIEDSLAQNCPVVMQMRGDLSHFTVVGAADAKLLHFFDSDQLKDIERSQLGIRSEYHQISAKSLFRIRATAKEPPEEQETFAITVVTGGVS